jgi:hypothetical protein
MPEIEGPLKLIAWKASNCSFEMCQVVSASSNILLVKVPLNVGN